VTKCKRLVNDLCRQPANREYLSLALRFYFYSHVLRLSSKNPHL